MNHGESTRKNKVTLKDIALKTGYSINTVSRALKDKYDISKKTRNFLKDIAKEMGYIPNSIAGSLRSGRTKTIAIILGDISNPIFAILVKELEKLLRNNQYNTIIINTEEQYVLEKDAITMSISKNVDGIILFPSQMRSDDIQFLKTKGIPFILLGRHFKNVDTDYIILDDEKGGYLATQHLLDHGHTRILLLNGPRYISCAMGRYLGYIKALRERGVGVVDELVREISVISGDCQHVVKQVVEDGVEFTAIFSFSDLIAWEAIYTLQGLGLKVPADIAVVGYDNLQSKFFIPFPLTTVHYSKSEMAERAVDILLKRITSHQAIDGYFQRVIETELIARGTV